MCANFQLKRITLTFLAQIWPKRRLGFEIQKTNVGIRINILKIRCVLIFRQNGQLSIFGPNFYPKMDFGLEISKILVLIRNQHPWDACAPIFTENGQLWIFGPKFAQKWILRSKFQKSKSGSEISILGVLGQNLPKNGFWGWDFKNLSLNSESAPPIYHVCQFSVKMDNF